MACKLHDPNYNVALTSLHRTILDTYNITIQRYFSTMMSTPSICPGIHIIVLMDVNLSLVAKKPD